VASAPNAIGPPGGAPVSRLPERPGARFRSRLPRRCRKQSTSRRRRTRRRGTDPPRIRAGRERAASGPAPPAETKRSADSARPSTLSDPAGRGRVGADGRSRGSRATAVRRRRAPFPRVGSFESHRPGRIRPAGRALHRQLSVEPARRPKSPPCGAGRDPTLHPSPAGATRQACPGDITVDPERTGEPRAVTAGQDDGGVLAHRSPLCWRSLATIPVQPVWWLAPMPAPLSPWKYS